MENEGTSFRTGLFVDGNNIFRSDFPIDYKALYDWAARDHNLLRATAYIIIDTENPDKSRPFVHFLMSTGFKVVQRPLVRTPEGFIRSSTSVSLAVDMLLQARHLDIILLVSGDGNIVPAVEEVQRMGRRVEVIAFTDRLSKDLLDSADHFIPLQKVDNIQREPVRREFRGLDEEGPGPAAKGGQWSEPGFDSLDDEEARPAVKRPRRGPAKGDEDEEGDDKSPEEL